MSVQPALSPSARTADQPAHAGSPVFPAIDAGHDGRDPGAHGRNRVPEQRLAGRRLSIAERSGRTTRHPCHVDPQARCCYHAEAPVAMTRLSGAGLFLSLHVDTSSKQHGRGHVIYSVSKQRWQLLVTSWRTGNNVWTAGGCKGKRLKCLVYSRSNLPSFACHERPMCSHCKDQCVHTADRRRLPD